MYSEIEKECWGEVLVKYLDTPLYIPLHHDKMINAIKCSCKEDYLSVDPEKLLSIMEEHLHLLVLARTEDLPF